VALVVTVVACILTIYTDAKWMIIPNWLTHSLIGFGLLYHLVQGWGAFRSSLMIGLIVGFFFFIPSVLGQVGMGDVKFMTGIGIWSNLLFVIKAFVLATFIALFHILVLLAWRIIVKKQAYRDIRKVPIPYGVSLGLGILIVTVLNSW
jgi:prepilin peptidase CpaA